MCGYLEYFALVLLSMDRPDPGVHHLELVVGEVGQKRRHIPIKVPIPQYILLTLTGLWHEIFYIFCSSEQSFVANFLRDSW